MSVLKRVTSRRRLLAGFASAAATAALAACAAPPAPTATPAPAKPAEAPKPAAAPTTAPPAATKPAEPTKPAEATKPAAAATKPAEATKPAAAPATKPGGDSLIVGLSQTARQDEFDASQVFEFQTKIYAFAVSESLVLYDYRDGKFKPRLAESWEIAPDLKSIAFKLRRGVKFHSGTPFNADAVVFSFDRIFKEGDPNGKDGQFLYKSFVPFYDKTEKIDDLTVRVVFNQTDALILQRFALDTSYIADPEAVKKHGNRAYSTDATKYSGTGPYKSVELQPQQLVRLERNDDWWGTPKPAFKNLVFRLFGRDQAGADARVNALLAREIDVGLYLPGTRRNDLAKAAGQGLETQWFPQFVLGYFYINHTLPVFKDKRVRQAMARSLDRKKFLEATAGPTTIPHTGFWYPDSPFYNKDASLEFDPVLAKKLLEDAGFTRVGADGIRERPSDGTRLSFNFTFGGTAASPPDVYTFWQQQLKELIGAEAKMLPFDPGISHEFEKGPLGPQNLGISSFGVGTWLGDPEFAYDRWITEKRGPVGFNHSQYSNPEMDSLYKQSRGIGDAEKRAEIFKKMQALAAEDVAWIPYNISTMGGAWWKDKVSNVTAGATQYSYPWTYELPKA